jgi:ABC-2 type transport system permease protein
MNLGYVLKREIRDIFITDPRRALFLLGASLAYLILFSILYSTHTVNTVPLVIYDEDQTQFSRLLIQALDDSERFQIISYVTSQDDMEHVLHEKEAYAAVHIPKKFNQDAKFGRSSTLLLMVDGSNIIITNTVTNAVQEIVATFAKETAAKLVEINNGQMPNIAINTVGPIDFRLRVLNNPTQSYISFFVIGLALAAFQQGIFLSVGAGIQSEYQKSTDWKNVHPLAIMAGKLLPYFFLALIAFFLTIIVGVKLMALPCKTSITTLFLLSAAFVLAAVGFSALLASICNNELTFTRISIAYTVPAFVFSGYTWPQEAMDTLGKTISYTFPLSYVSNTVRELMVAGYSPVVYRNSLILFLIGIALTAMATVCYIRRLKHLNDTRRLAV